ncbi:translocation/assembly module TamB domain-containing protein [Allomuricauda sp. SCSIO 65647]|uniref:translocation/assembly module TamB domain-containing protein n=1 Tax=Allomuricauda sp. SCSIO 65647 TaxID=2908843 RepID=UPI001F486056|nr:translocation/assembly module TamB domain-containing protein [Muricauda sp. SCSIO 65647]UJH66987.1 translocation/assembly module TamB [Muricauda sp. SCSIO 65647]
MLVILLIAVLGSLILSLPIVQTRLAKNITDRINTDFGTNINIDRVQLSLLSLNAGLKGIYVEDYNKDTLIYIEKLSTSILNLRNMANNKMEFGDVDINGLYLNLKTYEGKGFTNLDVFVDKLDDGKPRAPGTPPFYLSSSEVNIADSRFKLSDENTEPVEQLHFKRLQVLARDFQILGPDVATGIEKLSFLSKRDIAVDHLETEFKYTKQQMRFDSLLIKTPESSLQGDLVFNYNREDFKDFLDKVSIEGNFTESAVAFKEINKYFDEFGSDKTATFSTRFSGFLNDLNVEGLILQSDNTGIRGDFKFRNMFNKQAPFVMDATMEDVTSSYYELRSLLPNIIGKSIPSSFQKFGQFTVRGEAEISETSVDAQINLHTAIGSTYTNLQMTNINNIDNASYLGFISLMDFDLGEFIDDPNFGKTTLDVNVEGKGFIAEYLNTEAIGEIYSLEFNGYEYNNINVSGVLKDQLFDGSLLVNDDNFRFDFKGLADFSEERTGFNFIADVDYLDLRALNFIDDSISIFKGNVNMDITGNDLDNVSGDIRFSNTTYQNKNDTYFFEDFAVSSTFEGDSIRNIQIISPDIITGYVKGNFKVREMDKLLQNSIGSIYTNYRPHEVSSGQKVSFNLKIYNKIVDVFFPEVKFGPDTYIRGNIIADEGDFKLTFKSPNIEAFQNELKDIELKIDNKNPLFNTFLSVDEMSTVYYDVKDFNLINTTLKDTLFFRTEFKGGSEYNDSYRLNFYHTFNEKNKSVVGLKRSEVSFKDNTWVLNKESNDKNKVIFNKTFDSIRIEEVVMNNDNREQIRLRGELADSTYKDLELQFKIVSLRKISPAIDSLRLDGEVNGSLNILQKDSKYLPTTNMSIGNFSVNDIPLGDLEIGIFGNNDLTEFGVNTWLSDKGKEKLSLNGNVFNKNKKVLLDLNATFNNFDLLPFSPLGEDVISNIRGLVNGSAAITGDASNPKIDGELTLNDAGLGIPYLNVDYDFSPLSKVRLFDQTFYFENIGLTDVVEGTKASLDGTISHEGFDDWQLDLDLDTNNGRFLVLNTDFDEEALYYGTGFISGTGSIYGPTNALNITMDATTASGTSLKIPLSDVTSVGDYSFINFIDKNAEKTIEAERVLDEYQGLEMAFDLVVTPDAEVEIVVDRSTGSSLRGTGEGILLIEINTNGKFNMYGDFVVVTGEYNFKYGGVIDKTFNVRPGGTILWERDPLAALLDMEAVYALSANPGPLLDNTGYRGRIPTEVVVRLRGELESPSIDFDIEFPGTSSVVLSQLEYRLQDPTVEERNAFFLLAQGTFVNEQTGLNQQAVTGNLIQTASGLLNQILGGNNDKFNFGLSYEQGLLDTETDFRAEDRIGVTVSTQISDRILVNGRVGVPVGGVSETVVAGDVEVQVILNEEGTLSAKIFNRENQVQQFFAERQGYTQGVGLSYQVDFNSFRDLLRKVFQKKEKAKEGQPPESIPSNVMGKDSLIRFYTKTNSPK